MTTACECWLRRDRCTTSVLPRWCARSVHWLTTRMRARTIRPSHCWKKRGRDWRLHRRADPRPVDSPPGLHQQLRFLATSRPRIKRTFLTLLADPRRTTSTAAEFYRLYSIPVTGATD